MIRFFVPGIPVPKGSAKAFYIKSLGRAVVTQDNAKKQKPWASMIAVMAQNAGCTVLDGAVCIDLAFVFPRPKSHFGSGKNAANVKAGAPVDHTVKPDLDKLVRCVLDALTGVAWRDDSQVVRIEADKHYAACPGCSIVIQKDGTWKEKE